MTALAIGSSATVSLRDAGQVTVSTNGGFASVTVTPTAGVAQTVSIGPGPTRRTFGPYTEGATIVMVNSSVGEMDYDRPGGNVATFSADGSSFVGADGKITGWGRNITGAGAGAGFDPYGQSVSSTNILTVAGQTSSPVTVTDVVTPDGSGVRAINGTADKFIELNFILPYPMLIKQLGAVVSANALTQSAIAIYAGTDSVYTTFIARGIVVNSTGGKDGYNSNGLVGLKLAGPTPLDLWTNGSALNLDATLFTHIKVRCTPLSGQFADFTMLRWVANPSQRSRIALTFDDGYDSCFKWAVPLMQARGLHASFSIIPDLIGTAGYMTLAQLRELKANGHEILTHGPVGGAGSLTVNYANATLAVADAVASRQSLSDLGLITTSAEYATYIWPQGQYQFSAASTTLLDLMAAAGFTTGRVVQRNLSYSHSAARRTIYGGLLAPIFGHLRSVTTVGAEDAEIVACTTAIAYAAANGLDAVGMFHKIIGDQGTFSVTTTLDIEVTRFATILDAIVTQIAAGKATNELFSNFSGL
jgi:hypothetical protein